MNVLYKRAVRQFGHLPEVISRCTVSKHKKMRRNVLVGLAVITGDCLPGLLTAQDFGPAKPRFSFCNQF